MPTATGSCRWRFPRTGRRLCQDRATRRSKSGIQVRRKLKIAPPRPKLTLVVACLADKLELLSEKTDAHSSYIESVAFSPDGTKIVSDRTTRRSKSGILVRRELKIAPPWPKLTPVGLPGRQTGAAEREDGRPQQGHHVGRVLPGRDQDRVRIGGQDDQSLGSRCGARPSKLPLLVAQTDASWLVWQANWSC